MVVLASPDIALRRSYHECLRESGPVEEVRDLPELSQALEILRPSAAFVDPAILDPNPLSSLWTLSLRYRKVCFIAFGLEGDWTSEVNLLGSGVCGLLKRGSPPEVAPIVLKAVLRGELWVSRRVLTAFLNEVDAEGRIAWRPGDVSLSQDLKRLSGREVQVGRIAGAGLSNKEIACTLRISERTVKAHLTQLYKKLGIRSRPQLILLRKMAREASLNTENHGSLTELIGVVKPGV